MGEGWGIVNKGTKKKNKAQAAILMGNGKLISVAIVVPLKNPPFVLRIKLSLSLPSDSSWI